MDTVSDNVNENIPKMPTLVSINELQNALNEAIMNFGEKNKEVSTQIIMPVILDIMLTFPWNWLKVLGRTPEEFVAAITQEAELLKNQMPIREKQLEEYLKDKFEEQSLEEVE